MSEKPREYTAPELSPEEKNPEVAGRAIEPPVPQPEIPAVRAPTTVTVAPELAGEAERNIPDFLDQATAGVLQSQNLVEGSGEAGSLSPSAAASVEEALGNLAAKKRN